MQTPPLFLNQQRHDCQVEIRRIEGPHAIELFIRIYPLEAGGEASSAANAVYKALCATLDAEGTNIGSVVSEWVFCGDMTDDLAAIRAERDALYLRAADAKNKTPVSYMPAINEVGQMPLNPSNHFEMLFHATLPSNGSDSRQAVISESTCDCPECTRTRGIRVALNGESQLYGSAIFGKGEDAYSQTIAMFSAAEQMLMNEGMTFADVTRTWIYFSAMEQDYPGFNKARREFFTTRGVEPIPASTGIGANLASDTHRLSLGFVATRGTHSVTRMVMTTPTLNEAGDYGSDFSRGMRAEEINRSALYISGTASLDETGATVHLNNVEKQAERTLINVAALLEQQGASFKDVMSAITYIKHSEDVPLVMQKYKESGFSGFPHVVVQAEVCRPELLCETELLAVTSD